MNPEEFRDRQSRQKKQLATVYSVVMGAIILLVGVYFVTLTDTKKYMFLADNTVRYSFSTTCILYGGFRVFRGLKTTENE